MTVPRSVEEVPAGLIGCTWVATEIMGQPTLRIDRPLITLRQNGVVYGTGGCRRFLGAAVVEGEEIKIKVISSHDMLSPEPIAGQEEPFLRALDATCSFALATDTLHFFDALGTSLIRFEREPLPDQAYLRNAAQTLDLTLRDRAGA